jgi:hypothetical protein
MNFIVKLPPSRDPANPRSPPFDLILVVVDRFMKMAHFIPCYKTTTGPQLAHLIIKNMVARHEVPSSIVSDRGKPFIGKFMRELSGRLGIEQKFSMAYHSQTDSQTEHTN